METNPPRTGETDGTLEDGASTNGPTSASTEVAAGAPGAACRDFGVRRVPDPPESAAAEATEATEAAGGESAPPGGATSGTSKPTSGEEGAPDLSPRSEKDYDEVAEELVPHRTKVWIDKTFVSWSDLEAAVAALTAPAEGGRSHQRVVFVNGPEGTGRFATAVWMAIRMLGGNVGGRVVRLPESQMVGGDLVRWFLQGPVRRQSVYLMRDVDRRRVGHGRLSRDWMDLLQGQLRFDRLDAWLIVISEADGLELPASALRVTLPDAGPDRVQRVLERQVAWLEERREPVWVRGLGIQVKGLAGELARVLQTAPQAERFVLEAGSAGPEGNSEAALRELATRIARTETPTSDWFGSLNANEQLLALLVGVFEGLGQPELERIFLDLLARFLARPGTYRDPRRCGFDDLYRKIHARTRSSDLGEAKETTRVEFSHESYRREVLRQARSRRHLLWEVVEETCTWVNSLAAPWHGRARQFLGLAIARAGIHRQADLGKLLDALARDPRGTIASLPGSVLRGVLLLDEPDFDFVERTLERWLHACQQRADDAHDFAWAASVAIWRTYGVVRSDPVPDPVPGPVPDPDPDPDPLPATRASEVSGPVRAPSAAARLEEFLGRLAALPRVGDWCAGGGDFVSHAVREMFATRPAEIGRMIERWISSSEEALARAGRRAARRLFREFGTGEDLTDAQLTELLAMPGPLLRGHRDVVEEVVSRVDEWVGRPAMAARVEEALARASLRARPRDRFHLRRAAADAWLMSERRESRLMAMRLIAQLRLLDGAIAEAPGPGWGALLLDGAMLDWPARLGMRLASELLAHVRAQVEVELAQLGYRAGGCGSAAAFDAETLSVAPSAPRLMGPWLESFRRRSEPPLLVVSVPVGPVMDADDVAGMDLGFPVRTVPVALPTAAGGGPPAATGEGVRGPIVVSEQGLEDLLDVVDARVSEALAARLACRPASEWQRRLGPWLARWTGWRPRAGEDGDVSPVEIEAALDALLRSLDEGRGGDGAIPVADGLRTLYGGVLWLRAVAFEPALDWLVRRLARRGAAGACAEGAALMFLRLHGWADGTRAGSLFRLAPALARRDCLVGTRLVLELARRWARTSEAVAGMAMNEDLERMFRTVGRCWDRGARRALLEKLEAFERPDPDLPGTARPPKWVRSLGLRWRMHACQPSAQPVATGPMTLVITHAGSGQAEVDARLLAVADELRGAWEAGSTHRPARHAFVAAGNRRPRAVAGEASIRAAGGAGIVAPWIQGLAEADREWVVVLASAAIVDLEDWLGGIQPVERVRLYWLGPGLPPESGRAGWRRLGDQGPVREASRQLFEDLKPWFTHTQEKT